MSSLDGLVVTVSISLCFLVALIFKIFHKIWWTPIRVQKLMASQGIRGPPYRLIDGNAKEVSNMCKEAISRPLDLSHNILPVVLPHVHAWTKIYGKNYLQWHGTRAELVVTEAELCKEILSNKDGFYLKPKFRAYAKKIFGNGLPQLEGEKWAKSRKLANHAFHGQNLKNMIPDMIASAETMLVRWKSHEEGKEMDVYKEFRLLTSEVIARTAFGSSYVEGKNIFDMLMKLSLLKNDFKLKFPGFSKLFRTSDDIESDRLEKEIRDSIKGIVKKREDKAMNGEEESFGSDFLGLLLKAHHDTNDIQRISVDDLVDECKSFYFVGQETSNTLLSWTVLLLALHTDWQEKARKEVLQLFGKQTPNPDGLAKLKTMSIIFNESLRLYSPAVSVTRRVEKDVRLGKLIVPANVELIIPYLALHHEPESWGQDAQLFKPERFSEGVAKATNNNIATFLPFGMGPRICVGLNFATIEAKIALSMILQRYSFTLSPGYVHMPLKHMTLRPQHGVQVMLHSL
ncbi:cytochrome P450 CYP749A22-like isoform X1 [Rosa rugosa]|uniref:cytochrome P450 CYP749A22-like isoform X1 n=2 Tax=Rosa rugosa TaxID=74645 RepID=UPI002B40D7C8|nr:cytochrome P450 CYP749A22-like isoform X1 [Rosa rugosa]